jgi:hypothetical protein
MAACMPEPQTLLMVVASTDLGGRRRARPGGPGAWPRPAGRHAAHEDLVDAIRSYAGAFNGSAHGRSAQLGRGDGGELALEGAHRGAGVGEDDDGVLGRRGGGHWVYSFSENRSG